MTGKKKNKKKEKSLTSALFYGRHKVINKWAESWLKLVYHTLFLSSAILDLLHNYFFVLKLE